MVRDNSSTAGLQSAKKNYFFTDLYYMLSQRNSLYLYSGIHIKSILCFIFRFCELEIERGIFLTISRLVALL